MRESINQKVVEITSLFDNLIMSGNIQDAKTLLQSIEIVYNTWYNKLQNTIINKVKWFILEENSELSQLDLETKSKALLEKLKDTFGIYVVNELAIIKLKDHNITPVFFLTLNVDKINQLLTEEISTDQLKEELKENLKYFIENIISKWLLSDWEWTIAGNNVGEAYDLVLRVWEYVVWFNNTIESLEWLKNKFWIDQNSLIREISKFYYEFNR